MAESSHIPLNNLSTHCYYYSFIQKTFISGSLSKLFFIFRTSFKEKNNNSCLIIIIIFWYCYIKLKYHYLNFLFNKITLFPIKRIILKNYCFLILFINRLKEKIRCSRIIANCKLIDSIAFNLNKS